MYGIFNSDGNFILQVERWWGVLLPKVAPLLYENGGPIIMVQVGACCHYAAFDN